MGRVPADGQRPRRTLSRPVDFGNSLSSLLQYLTPCSRCCSSHQHFILHNVLLSSRDMFEVTVAHFCLSFSPSTCLSTTHCGEAEIKATWNPPALKNLASRIGDCVGVVSDLHHKKVHIEHCGLSEDKVTTSILGGEHGLPGGGGI